MGEKGKRFTYIPEVKREARGGYRFRCRCGATAWYGNVFEAAHFALVHILQVCRP